MSLAGGVGPTVIEIAVNVIRDGMTHKRVNHNEVSGSNISTSVDIIKRLDHETLIKVSNAQHVCIKLDAEQNLSIETQPAEKSEPANHGV